MAKHLQKSDWYSDDGANDEEPPPPLKTSMIIEIFVSGGLQIPCEHLSKGIGYPEEGISTPKLFLLVPAENSLAP